MLALTFELGLFDPAGAAPAAQASPADAHALVRSPAHAALALTAARQSIVLLINGRSKDRDTLPLDASRLRRIAVVGPTADITRLGGYSGTPLALPSILDAVRQRVGTACEVVHARGCEITARDERNAFANWKQDATALADPALNQQLIAQARAAVATSDLILLVLGDTEATTRESWGDKHPGDRSTLDLPGDQLALAQAMFDSDIPVVVFLMHGRPFALGPLQIGLLRWSTAGTQARPQRRRPWTSCSGT